MNPIRKNLHKTKKPVRPPEFANDPVGQRHRVRTVRELAGLPGSPLTGGVFATRLGCFERAAHHEVWRRGRIEPLVLLCMEGEGWVEMDGKRSRVQAGEAVWIDCRKAHGYGSSVERPWSIAWTHLGGSQMTHWKKHLAGGRSGARMIWRVGNPERAHAAFEELWKGVEAGESEIRNSLRCATWLAEMTSATARAESPDEDILEKIAREMRMNPNRDLSLAELARNAGYSKGHLLAMFRDRWGCPPKHYVIRQRMQRACALLETTAMKVEAIASEVGYDNPFYFSRLFSRTYGRSPKAFRAGRRDML